MFLHSHFVSATFPKRQIRDAQKGPLAQSPSEITEIIDNDNDNNILI